MGARLYDPGVGAFTSLDTVAGSAQSPLSMNRWLYARADPATLVDPTGHAAVLEDEAGTTLVRLGPGVKPRRLRRGRRADLWTQKLLAPGRRRAYDFRTRAASRTGYLQDQLQDAQTAQAKAGAMLRAAQGKDAQADVDYQSCHTVRCQMKSECAASGPQNYGSCMSYDGPPQAGLDRPAEDATPNLLVPLVMFGAPLLPLACVAGGCEAAAIGAAAGGGSYVGTKVLENIAAGKPATDGLDAGDAALAAAGGWLTGGLSTLGGPIFTGGGIAYRGLFTQMGINASIGSTQTGLSAVLHGRSPSPFQMGVGGLLATAGPVAGEGWSPLRQATTGFSLGVSNNLSLDALSRYDPQGP
jgi:hypothetical protein